MYVGSLASPDVHLARGRVHRPPTSTKHDTAAHTGVQRGTSDRGYTSVDEAVATTSSNADLKD